MKQVYIGNKYTYALVEELLDMKLLEMLKDARLEDLIATEQRNTFTISDPYLPSIDMLEPYQEVLEPVTAIHYGPTKKGRGGKIKRW